MLCRVKLPTGKGGTKKGLRKESRKKKEWTSTWHKFNTYLDWQQYHPKVGLAAKIKPHWNLKDGNDLTGSSVTCKCHQVASSSCDPPQTCTRIRTLGSDLDERCKAARFAVQWLPLPPAFSHLFAAAILLFCKLYGCVHAQSPKSQPGKSQILGYTILHHVGIHHTWWVSSTLSKWSSLMRNFGPFSVVHLVWLTPSHGHTSLLILFRWVKRRWGQDGKSDVIVLVSCGFGFVFLFTQILNEGTPQQELLEGGSQPNSAKHSAKIHGLEWWSCSHVRLQPLVMARRNQVGDHGWRTVPTSVCPWLGRSNARCCPCSRGRHLGEPAEFESGKTQMNDKIKIMGWYLW